MGRFLQTDSIFVTLRRLIDPLRLNLYAYTRNNPLRFIDPDGMILRLYAENEEEARRRLEKLKLGLDPSDRSAVSLIVGNGNNGCAAGQFCVGVDQNHSSNSNNFNSLQSAVGSSDIATLAVVDSSFVISYNTGVNQGGRIVLGPTESTFVGDNLPGLTLFQERDSPQEGASYSTTGDTRSYVSSEQMDIEIVATMYHELKHIVLTDFGKKIPTGKGHFHDKQTKEAEREAKENFRKQ